MTVDPDATTGASAADQNELERSGAENQQQQDREDDGGDRTHASSLAETLVGLHTDPRRPGIERDGDRSERLIGDLHPSAMLTVDRWLSELEQTEPAVLAIEKDGNRRFVRLRGDEKSVFTVWLLVGQHTLHHETFVMPAPIENHAEFYEHLLRRNHSLRGVAFTIGQEDAIFLEGRTPLEGLDAEVLDSIIGTHFDAVERFFRPAMRIGWRSMFRG